VDVTKYSLFSVTNPEWSVTVFGVLTICFVRKSRRSITATRPVTLSVVKIHSPS